MSDQKPLEDRKMDAFLDGAHKKSISEGIRQRNREKKLSKAEQDQISLQRISDTDTSSISPSSEKSVSEKNGKGLIQEISRNFDSPEISFTSGKEHHVTEISFTPGKENIIHLYQRASDAEGFAMKANQEEIL